MAKKKKPNSESYPLTVDYECSNFFPNETLAEVDEDTDFIIKKEEERQARKLIFIASESISPRAVREVLASVFTNIYAEGYPSQRMNKTERELLLDFDYQFAYHRRYWDKRYYKGADYADFVEALAQNRVAELFSTPDVPAEHIFANVQSLSGAPANNAIYEAFVKPGDTVMGMNLTYGGHLTHGSKSNRSGKHYNIVPYTANMLTGKLDYEQLKLLAIKHKPKMIIAGYSAFPWNIDWKKFREVADAAGGAILMADIAHTAGLVAAGQFNNPIGYADVVVFTTHKTLCGPRGAVILTTDEEKAQLINAAVFPGEQGGPHLNNIASKAVCFKLAQTKEFKEMQRKTVENAKYLAECFQKLGLKLAYGGTDSHLLLIDLKCLKSETGYPITGEIATRILDLCGITCNKNTIPGDTNAAHPTAIRFGMTWVTQRGITKAQIKKVAEIVHKVLTNIKPFKFIDTVDEEGFCDEIGRGKIDIEVLLEVQFEVQELIREINKNIPEFKSTYPHFYDFALKPDLKAADKLTGDLGFSNMGIIELTGDSDRISAFLHEASTNNLIDLAPGQGIRTLLIDKSGKLIDDVIVYHLSPQNNGLARFIVTTNQSNTERVLNWFRCLSDEYVIFDEDIDIYAKIQGPMIINDLKDITNRNRLLTELEITGSDSLKLLKKLNPKLQELQNETILETKLNGINTVITRMDYSKKDVHLTLFVHPHQGKQLLADILKAGKGLKITPLNKKLKDNLRRTAGLPVYDKKSKPTIIEIYNSKLKDLFILSKPYFIGQKKLLKRIKPTSKKNKYTYKPEKIPIRKSFLYEDHKKLGGKLVPFAGWEMPVIYTGSSILEEHTAVRQIAGLFDVSHMGVFEFKGKYATRFLDLLTSNYVSWLYPGQAHYSYLFDPDGKVIDDIFIYRVEKNRYMMVVNAANAEEDWAWINAVHSKKYIIDNANPDVEIEGEVLIRNLKDPRSGKDQLIDLAIQGPNSLKILQAVAGDKQTETRLGRLQKMDFIDIKLKEIPVRIARTGYTGAKIGFEMYVHPENASKLWNYLLEIGKKYGIKPTGLGARDSTRTEAGFPLHGDELAGVYNVSPVDAGYGAFVKLHKPYFIGRSAALRQAEHREMEIVRFKMPAKGLKVVKTHDPVANERGEFIGNVTSCVSIEGYQMGLAYVLRKYRKIGSQIFIYSLPRQQEHGAPAQMAKTTYKVGDKTIIPVPATVISRFPIENELEKNA